MAILRLEGWREGFNKVELNHLIRDYCQCGLAESKSIVDDLLDNQLVTIHVVDENLSIFMSKATNVGVKSIVQVDANGD